MSSTVRILAALVLGVSAGAVLAAAAPAAVGPCMAVAGAVGDLWLDALRMTVVPMIFALVVTGVGATLSAAAAGGMTARTLALFAVLLLGAALLGVVLMDLILAIFPIPGAAGAAMRSALAVGAVQTPVSPPAGEWLRGFIPANPIAAAANGAIAPLVVFSLAFGFAAIQIAPPLRAALLQVLDATLQTLLGIVAWVLKAAPLGVASLAFVAASHAGLGTAGALIHYVLTGALFCSILVVCLYPLVVLSSGVSLVGFAKAAAPAQLVAFSTQSSIGSLPAMVEATAALGGEPAARQVVLPLAVSLFRLGSAASGGAIALYVARLSGVTLNPAQMVVAAGLSAVVSIAAVGLPSQASFVTIMTPICLAVGAPLEALVLLMAVDSLPDAFRTVANVTGDIAVTAISSRAGRARRPPASAFQQGGGGAQVGGGEPLPESADH
jgi:Na+/H+-dicarboxylate symporter